MAENGDGMAENGDGTEEQTMYKLVLVGNSNVGKTAFLWRYTGKAFEPAYKATVGIDFMPKIVERGDKEIRLQLWDTAGQERYKSIVTAYFRGAAGFILMFDLSNQESFQGVNTWITSIKDKSGVDNPLIVLVGNKSDLKESRVIDPEQAREIAQSLGTEYFEASVKDNINVKEIIDYIIDKIEEPEEPAPEPAPEPKSKSPSATPEPKYKYCYC